jgi:hypothetical protein
MYERNGVARKWVTAVVALAWLSGIHSLGATTLAPADFEQMVAASQTIVRGRVERVQAVLEGPRRTIETVVTLTVLDELKGETGGAVVFRVPGGQIGQYRRVMIGAPELVEGDEVVVFLKGRAPVVPMPFGLNQGVYRVQQTGTGRLVAPFVPQPGRVVRGDPGRRLPSVDEFARAVRAVAGRQP